MHVYNEQKVLHRFVQERHLVNMKLDRNDDQQSCYACYDSDLRSSKTLWSSC